MSEGKGEGKRRREKYGAKPMGMALYYFTYSTWRSKPGIYLEDLYVRPEARGRGYGKALIREMARLVSVFFFEFAGGHGCLSGGRKAKGS